MAHCTYIFLDESGNLDFSAKGTRYFVLTSVSARRPFKWSAPMEDYKYDCLEYGSEQEYFHCAHDKKLVRGKVFDIVVDHLDAVRIDNLAIEKRKVSEELQEISRFYPEILGRLLEIVVPQELNRGADKIVVITDTLPVQKKKRTVEKAVKTALGRMLPHEERYRMLHHESRSHYGLQFADYCCWAIARKLQNGEAKYYDRISSAVRGEYRWRQGGALVR